MRRWRSLELRLWNGAVDRNLTAPLKAIVTINYAREPSSAPLGPIPAPVHKTLSCRSLLELSLELKQLLEVQDE